MLRRLETDEAEVADSASKNRGEPHFIEFYQEVSGHLDICTLRHAWTGADA
jgi:hypothetical protein